jgi:hypothetical protein
MRIRRISSPPEEALTELLPAWEDDALPDEAVEVPPDVDPVVEDALAVESADAAVAEPLIDVPEPTTPDDPAPMSTTSGAAHRVS